MLIREGAKIVLSVEDIVSNYGFLKKKKIAEKQIIKDGESIPEEYKEIFNVISNEPIEINDIMKLSKKKLNEVMAKLTILELEGKIQKVAGNRYIRK